MIDEQPRLETIWDKLIPRIEEALGFELRERQKHYLKTGEYTWSGRATGKTTAYCIKLAITRRDPLKLSEIGSYRDEEHGPQYIIWFKHYFLGIWIKLKTAGIPVCEITDFKPKERESFKPEADDPLGPLCHIYLNDRFSCSLAIPDIKAYMSSHFPGAEYQVSRARGEIRITADEPQLEEIAQYRYSHYVGD